MIDEEELDEETCEQCGNLADDCECCYECGEYDCICDVDDAEDDGGEDDEPGTDGGVPVAES